MKSKLVGLGICAGFFLLSAALATQALAQSYPSRAAAHLKAETARWSKVIAQAGIKRE